MYRFIRSSSYANFRLVKGDFYFEKKFIKTKSGGNVRIITKYDGNFDEFMLIKKGEGLAKRTITDHYNNFGYFKDYIKCELLPDEMKTELFMDWISFMLEEMDYSPMTINIRVRTMRAFLRYCTRIRRFILYS